MPDWTAPFYVPKLTDAKYAAQKAAYQAEHGFTITIPGLFDIIKIQTEQPMTALEDYWWKTKDWDKFSALRLQEVRGQKQKRKDRYMAMLASPTPAIFQNAGSILTAVDDAQDAISTLAAIGQLGRAVTPTIVGKYLKGPVGILALASDALNLVQNTATWCMAPMYGKRNAEGLAQGSPQTMRHKLKNRMNMKAKLPGKADWIQGLQTSEQVFGFGISLGPIVGLMQDIVFGSVRTTFKESPKIKFPIPSFSEWHAKALKCVKSMSILWGYDWRTDDEDILLWTAAAALSFQMIMSEYGVWNPLENIEEVELLEIQAPMPWHTLTKEVIDEGPVPLDMSVGWPQTNTTWATMGDLIDNTQDVATANFTSFQDRNKHDWIAWLGGNNVREAAASALAALEGSEDLSYEFSVPYMAATTMIQNQIYLNPDQPSEKFELFVSFLKDCEATNWNPTIDNIIEFCTSPWNEIALLQQTGTST